MSESLLPHVGWILAIAFFLVGGTNQVLRLVDRLKPREPAPPLLEQFMPRRECDERHVNLLTGGELREEFLTRREWLQAEKDLREIKRDVKVLLQRTSGQAMSDEVAQA